MNNIYDNGAIMLGSVKKVREEIKKEIELDIDMSFADMEEILKDIEDLDDNDIVAINYDCGNMGYSIDYWHNSHDLIKESE